MRRAVLLLVVLASSLGLASACGEDESTPAALEGRTPEELTRALRAAATELAARPEHTAPEVSVQHLLVSFQGTPTSAVRTRDEAERLAAELFARAQAGEDFDLLVKNHTDDAHPGIYVLSQGPSPRPGVFARADMVPAFGSVGWRLGVGEIGVAAYDPETSPFGWHLVKRLE